MWGEPSPPGGSEASGSFDWPSLAPANRHAARRALQTDWLTGLVEESFLFHDGFVAAKHSEKDEAIEEQTSDDSKPKKEPKTKSEDWAQKLFGVVELSESELANLSHKSVQQWLRDLQRACNAVQESSSSFRSLFNRRVEVQELIRAAALKEKEHGEVLQKTSALALLQESANFIDMPASLRLGLLMLFPVIESLRDAQGVKYQQLCSRLLEVFISVLASLQPLSLQSEPNDCMNELEAFFTKLLEVDSFQINTQAQVQAITALVGLVLSRASIRGLVALVNVTLRLQTTPTGAVWLARIVPYLKQLTEAGKKEEFSILSDRSYLASWSIPGGVASFSEGQQNDSNNGSALAAIATDSHHLYMHSPMHGLMKIGTGAGSTIRGALIAQNVAYRTGDSRRSIAFANGKLLYTSPELSQPRADPRQAKVAVVNTETLQEEAVVTLPFSADPDSHVIMSDGQQFYLLARLITEKPSNSNGNASRDFGLHTSKEPKEAMEDRFSVEIFTVSASNIIARMRTVSLERAPVNVSTGEKPIDEPALSSNAYERGTAFVTGSQMCVLWGMPLGMGGHESGFKSRAFSLADGKHIATTQCNSETTGMAACYDSANNGIYTYSQAQSRVSEYANVGPAPTHCRAVNHQHAIEDPFYSPEAALAAISATPSTPVEFSTFLLIHADRLARQHSVYSSLRVASSSCVRADGGRAPFSVEPEQATFRELHKLLRGACDALVAKPDAALSQILLCGLRVLKVNLFEWVVSGKGEALTEAAPLKALLLQLIATPPTSGPRSETIQLAACHALITGFAALFDFPKEGAQFLVELFDKGTSGSPLLLTLLLRALADSNVVVELAFATPEAMITVASAEEPNTLSPLTFALLDHCITEATSAIDALAGMAPQSSPTPHHSPALRILTAVQRELTLRSAKRVQTLFALEILDRSRELIEYVLTKKPVSLPATALLAALQGSIVGPLLQSTVLDWAHKSCSRDLTVVQKLFPALRKLLASLDQCNNFLPDATVADGQYARRLGSKEAKRRVAETKHPYPVGKSQTKETVTIAGAKALRLRFDPRCQTVNGGNDMVQLFKNANLSEAVSNSRDGNTLMYGGRNWPTSSIVVPGDTVTLLFNSNSRPDPSTPLSSRYGYRCVVTPVENAPQNAALVPHWLLDVENAVAQLCVRFVASLVEGESFSAKELKCMQWLDSPLLSGGIDPAPSAFLTGFASGSEAATLFAWMKNITRGVRAQATPETQGWLDDAERIVIAAILKHSGLMSEAQAFAKLLATSSSGTNERLQQVAQHTAKLTRWLAFRLQLYAKWRRGVEEPASFDWALDKAAMLELLETLGADSKMKALSESELLADLHKRFQEATEKKTPLLGARQMLVDPVISRAGLLLRLREDKLADSPAADKANPFAMGRTVTLLPPSLTASGDTTRTSMLRSASAVSETEFAKQREKRKAMDEQKNKSFSRRVKELRKWLQAHKWKRGQEGEVGVADELPPQSAVAAVTAFAQNSSSAADFTELISTHARRAKTRREGLVYLREMLDLGAFTSIRHQLLGAVVPLFHGGHYLDHVSAAGPEACRDVSEAFATLVERMVSYLHSVALDNVSRLLALGVCAVRFREADAELLARYKVLAALHHIAVAPTAVLMGFSSAMDLDEPSDEERDRRQQQEEELRAEHKRQTSLHNSAWTALRLVAALCVGWSREERGTESVEHLQQQTAQLVCGELHRLTDERHEPSERSYQLLSLLSFVSASAQGHQFLCKPENVASLVALLRRHATPRSTRLALRLLRHLLPGAAQSEAKKLAEFLLTSLGQILCGETSEIHKSAVPVASAEGTDAAAAPKGKEEKAAGELEAKEQYTVWLHLWTQGHQRLIEVCLNTFGPEFFGPLAGLPGSVARITADARARQMVRDMDRPDGALLRTAGKDDCTRLANALVQAGGTVTVKPATSANAQSPDVQNRATAASRNRALARSPAATWTSGAVASGIASEYVALLRILAVNASWSAVLTGVLTTAMAQLPTLNLNEPLTAQHHAVLATLSVLGGFTETIRVGGRVELEAAPGEPRKAGTVVGFPQGVTDKAFVCALQSNVTRPQKLDTCRLQPVAEQIVPALNLGEEHILALLSFMHNKNLATTPLLCDLRSRAAKVLMHVARSVSTPKGLLRNKEALSALAELAASAKSASRLSLLEQQKMRVAEGLWDMRTRPKEAEQAQPMAALLPHYPYSNLAVLLPTTFERPRILGVLFSGEDRRTAEFSGWSAPVPRGGPPRWRGVFGGGPPEVPQPNAAGEREVLLLGNMPVPIVPEHYFEVTIEKTQGSSPVISIGLCPERANAWVEGSWRYQANSKKCTVAGGNRRLENYGAFFRQGNVIGCRWNRDTRVISFTRDGEDLGVAFREVQPSGNVVPVVGLGPGVRVRINFGQEPFLGRVARESEKMEESSPADEEAKAKKRAEEEARRKKERDEEEARRRKEKEDLEAGRRAAALPIVNIGYTLKQAMKALASTGFAGTDAAVGWLLDNPDAANEEEPSEELKEKKEDDEKKSKKEEEEKTKKDELPVKAGEAKPAAAEPAADVAMSAVIADQYNHGAALSYHIGTCFGFPERNSADASAGGAGGAPNEWEDQVLPQVKQFMENDNNFSRFEQDEFLTQIRMQLAQNNEAEARRMVAQIVGESGAVQLPIPGGSKAGPTPLKIEELKIGGCVTITSLQHSGEVSCSVGSVGRIKSIDVQASLVLVEVYEAERGQLGCWWFNLRDLSQSSAAVSQPVPTAAEPLFAQLCELGTELTRLYARKALLALSASLPLTLDAGAFGVRQVLQLSAAEQSAEYTPSGNGNGNHNNNGTCVALLPALRSRIDTLYATPDAERRAQITQVLVGECVDQLVAVGRLAATSSAVITSRNPAPSTPERIVVEAAQSLQLVFDRSCAIPVGPTLRLGVYRDEACTDQLACFRDVGQLEPLLIPANKAWIRVEGEGPQRNNARYKFNVTPVHHGASLALWLAADLLTRPGAQLDKVLQSTIDIVYALRSPSPLKNEVINLLARLLRAPQLPPAELQRLLPLREEVVHLHETEKKRGGLFSVYLQNLTEALVALRRAGALPDDITMTEADMDNKAGRKDSTPSAPRKSSPPKNPSSSSSKPAAPSLAAAAPAPKGKMGARGDEDMALAMALAASLNPNKAPAASSEDAELEAALALSKAEAEPAKPAAELAKPAIAAPPAVSDPSAKPAAVVAPPAEAKLSVPPNQSASLSDDQEAAAIALSLGEGKDSSAPSSPALVSLPAPAEIKPVPKDVGFHFTPAAAGAPPPISPVPMPVPMPPGMQAFGFGSGAPPVLSPFSAGPPPGFNVGSGNFGSGWPAAPPKGASFPKGPPPGMMMMSPMNVAMSPLPNSPAPLSATPAAAPVTTVVANPAKKRSEGMAWFVSMCETVALMDALGGLTPLDNRAIEDAWKETRTECIRDRLLALEGLPQVPSDKCEELVASLRRLLADTGRLLDAYVPIDESGNVRGFAVLEIVTDKVSDAVKKLQSQKVKIGAMNGLLKALPARQWEKDNDARYVGYLRTRLLTNGTEPSARFRVVLSEVFERFGGNSEGALSPAALDALQVACTGEHLDAEKTASILAQYEAIALRTAPGQRGLSLAGLVALYGAQAKSSPLETVDELCKLGYDLHLERTATASLAEAAGLLNSWPAGTDASVVAYADQLAVELELRSPSQLLPAYIGVLGRPPNGIPFTALRLRFAVLRQFNERLANVLPLINLARTLEEGSLAWRLTRVRPLLFHSTKMSFAYEILDKSAVAGNQPSVTIDRLRLATKKDKEGGIIDSDKILSRTAFGAAFEQLRQADRSLLRQKKPPGTEPHVAFKVVFKGEHVEGEGGPYRQFFTDVAQELQHLPLLVPSPNASAKLGEGRDKYVLASARESATDLAMYEFLGRLMGMAVRTGALLVLDLPSFVWKPLVSQARDTEDLRRIDSAFCEAMDFIRKCKREEFEASVFEKFTAVRSDKSVIPLKEGGEDIDVTYDNREEYVRLLLDARLSEGMRQQAAVQRGLAEIVPLMLLNLLTWQDLEWRVCGKPQIDIQLLRRHTEYSNVSPDAPHILFFWQVLQELSQEDRRRFVRFAWAQERLPSDDHEFQRTRTRMLIKPFMGISNPDATFPKADTCFFNIMLPEYSSLAILREKLLFAIANTDTMDADTRPDPQAEQQSRFARLGIMVAPSLASINVNEEAHSSSSSESDPDGEDS